MASVTLARTLWIPSALGLIGSIAWFAIQPYKLVGPAALSAYSSRDGSVKLLRPSNWKGKTLDLHGVTSSVRFEPSRDVVFEVGTDLAGSLMADVLRSSDSAQASLDSMMADAARSNPDLARRLGGLGAGAPRKSPVEKMHDANRMVLERLLKEYRETAPARTTLCGLEAMESGFTFTGSGLWGARRMAGTRITVLAPDREVRVVYYAPADQMRQLGAVFAQMRNSLQIGAGGTGR